MDTSQSSTSSQTEQTKPRGEEESSYKITDKFPRMSSQYFRPMDDEGTKLFAQAMFAEFGAKKDGKFDTIPVLDKPQDDFPPLLNIMMLRIEKMELPIKFTQTAAIGCLALVRNPGQIVVFLIECLTMYEGKVVDMDKIAHLYPAGFYKEEALADIIDNYMKPRQCKWSWVYGSRV